MATLQYSYLEKSMDRGACQAIVHRVARVAHDLLTQPVPAHWALGSLFGPEDGAREL